MVVTVTLPLGSPPGFLLWDPTESCTYYLSLSRRSEPGVRQASAWVLMGGTQMPLAMSLPHLLLSLQNRHIQGKG